MNFSKALSAVCSGMVVVFALASISANAAECLPAPKDLVQPGVLTIGTALAAPPMGYSMAEKAEGFDPEIMTAVAKSMCLEPKFVNVAFAGLFPGLISKKFDVVASMVGITDQRKEAFDFVPYFLGGVRLVAMKKNDLALQTESDVCGHTAAIMAGSTQMAALEKVKDSCPAGKPMVLKAFSGQAEALNELARGSADVAYVDWPVAAYVVQQKPDFAEVSPILSGKGPGTQRNRIGMVIQKGDADKQQAIQSAFSSLESSGVYDQLMAKWNLKGGDIRHPD